MQMLGINPDWEGDIEKLIEEITRLAEKLGLSKATLSESKKSKGLTFANKRLIADYKGRQIISTPKKSGRVSIYGIRHVLEFLAAKKMLKLKWPIQEIGSTLKEHSLEEILDFVVHGKTIGATIEEKRAAQLLEEMRRAREAATSLGHPEETPLSEQLTLIVVTSWCQMLVESRRLQNVTKEEAIEIGRVVKKLLLNEEIRKQAAGN